MTYSTTIKATIPINQKLFYIFSNTLSSSSIFLAFMKLNIYNQTNKLKTNVKCLEGP